MGLNFQEKSVTQGVITLYFRLNSTALMTDKNKGELLKSVLSATTVVYWVFRLPALDR